MRTYTPAMESHVVDTRDFNAKTQRRKDAKGLLPERPRYRHPEEPAPAAGVETWVDTRAPLTVILSEGHPAQLDGTSRRIPWRLDPGYLAQRSNTAVFRAPPPGLAGWIEGPRDPSTASLRPRRNASAQDDGIGDRQIPLHRVGYNPITTSLRLCAFPLRNDFPRNRGFGG
jgi:hypothetical protein